MSIIFLCYAIDSGCLQRFPHCEAALPPAFMNGTPPSTNIFSNAGTAALLDGHALYMQLSAKTPASCRHCLLHRQSPDVPAVKCFGNLPIGFISFAVIKKPCTLLCRADDSIWGYFPLRQHCTIPALRLKHRSGSCGTASALPKCSIMSGCGTRIVLLFAVSATGGAHLCSIQYYLRFWLGICRTSLAVSALRIMRYCLWYFPMGVTSVSV